MYNREKLIQGIITINVPNTNQIIELSGENVHQIYDQIKLIDALNTLDCFNVDRKEFDDEDLFELQDAIEDELYCDSGDIEWDVLRRLGFVD